MLVQVNTNASVRGDADIDRRVEDAVRAALGRYENAITRVEVHLNDVNAGKHGPADKRCAVELRLEKRRPETVTHAAAGLVEAWTGALDKAVRLLERTDGRLGEPRREAARRRPGKRRGKVVDGADGAARED